MMIELKDLEKVINSGLTTLIKTSEIKFDQLVIHCKIENIFEIILFLKNNEKCKFKQLIDITAIDYPEKRKKI